MNEKNEGNAGTQTFRSEVGGGPANPKTVRFVALFIIGLIVTVVLLTGRREVARWYDAAARNAYLDERYDDAIESANMALKWDADNESVVELRVLARMKNRDFEGCIADCDELLAEAAKDGVENEKDYAPLPQKATALQSLGRHKETLEIWSKIIEYRKREFELRDDYESRYQYAMSLNNRAYMVAQAYVGTEVEEEGVVEETESYDIAEALDQIDLALKIRQVPDDAVMLDTQGYLLLLNGRAEEAVEKLEEAVRLTKKENRARRKQLQNAIKSAEKSGPFEMALKELDQQFSIILHHRGEAYLQIDELDKAARDIAEAKKLGYNPAEGIW